MFLRISLLSLLVFTITFVFYFNFLQSIFVSFLTIAEEVILNLTVRYLLWCENCYKVGAHPSLPYPAIIKVIYFASLLFETYPVEFTQPACISLSLRRGLLYLKTKVIIFAFRYTHTHAPWNRFIWVERQISSESFFSTAYGYPTDVYGNSIVMKDKHTHTYTGARMKETKREWLSLTLIHYIEVGYLWWWLILKLNSIMCDR